MASLQYTASINQCHLGSNCSEPEPADDCTVDNKNWPALIILVIIFFTVGGNILVILAVTLEKKLHNATNFFLRSLAVADLLVGILVMPASLISVLYNYTWPLPRVLCPMWLFLDVLFSTASIMHLCAISLDRYIGIRSPIQYSLNNSPCRAMGKIVAVWTISVVVSSPIPVIGIQDEEKVFLNCSCVLNEPRFVLAGSFVAFFVPLVVMVICYCLTTRVLQQHTETISRSHALHPQQPSARQPSSQQPSPQPSLSDASLLNEEPASDGGQAMPRGREVAGYLAAPLRGPEGGANHGLGRRGMAQAVKNERRASKVLGAVFFLFLVMWCPFFITNVLLAVCQSDCGEHLSEMMNLFVWVGYVSSGVNPLVYTLFNKTYRHAFTRYLHCRYHRQTKALPSSSPCQVYSVTPTPVLGGRRYANGNKGLDSSNLIHKQPDQMPKEELDSLQEQ
ncbi:5-hydroxytryptamine (serotonin) receptor 2C, G protein-coupled-like 2 isoform X2 [Brachyhypopomus gauderio]|uniref:5-hydroxytryptamine (serotonin) receptor 2C, G protein-coupled-like 2 isoform X2 n=1 Tax=Brachyhypopomus gauderio TaxID=698409 RepID=UPI00404102AA